MLEMSTKRLLIRDFILEDLQSFHKLLINDKAMHYLPDIKTSTYEESRQNILEAIRQSTLSERQKYYFAIISKDTKEFIGSIGFTVLANDKKDRAAGLGYFILPEYWGRGITTEAAKAVVEFIFSYTDILNIEAGCAKKNIASEQVMQKIGMSKTQNPPNNRVHYSLHKTIG